MARARETTGCVFRRGETAPDLDGFGPGFLVWIWLSGISESGLALSCAVAGRGDTAPGLDVGREWKDALSAGLTLVAVNAGTLAAGPVTPEAAGRLPLVVDPVDLPCATSRLNHVWNQGKN